MINNFTENPFLNTRISNANFGMFVKSHLEFLIAANKNSLYSSMISSLKAVYEPFDLWLEKYDKNITNRKGKTKTIDSIINNFKIFVKKEVYKEVNYKFGSEMKEKFNEFFPNGLTEYNQLTKKTASVLFDRIEKATIKYKSDLKVGLDIEATAFNTDYEQALKDQLSGKGNVKDASQEGETLREAIAIVMFSNLLDQLKLHISTPKDVLSLYDTAVLNKSKGKKKIAKLSV